MVSAEIVSIERVGGYKEPLQRIVKSSYDGFRCLDKLEADLSMQLQAEYQSNDESKKLLVKINNTNQK